MRRFSAVAWQVAASIAGAAGVFLRLYQLRGQMLIDDEWHSVRKLLGSDIANIATHFGYADYCIPLTLYYRWLFDHGWLDEWQMHLPLLLAGIAATFVAPWMLRRELPASLRTIWIGLLAISPSLIYFSRTARPYALITLLAPMAIIAFRNWQRDPAAWRRWLPLYVGATAMAGWLHLLSLVFTLWPFVFYGVAALRDCRRQVTRGKGLRNLAALVALGVCTILPLVLLLAPPLLHDWASMRAKAGRASMTMESFYDAVSMQFGVGNALLCAALTALWFWGVIRVWQRDREFAALVLGASMAGAVVIYFAHPAWIQHAQVLVRYASPVLPFLLLFLAAGVGDLCERVPEMFSPALAGAGIAALATLGPLPEWLYRPNQFMGHGVYQFSYSPSKNPYVTQLELGPIPAFFLEIAQRPPASVTLIETPRRAESNFMPDPWYQKIHRQNVKYALAGPICGAGTWDIVESTRGAPFRNLVSLDDVLAGAHHGGDYLVMNLIPWTLPSGAAFPWHVDWPDMQTCVAKVEARIGVPIFRDEAIVVFALDQTGTSKSTRPD